MRALWYSLIGSVLIGWAWLIPLDSFGELLNFFGVMFLAVGLHRSGNVKRDWYTAGVLFHLIGFHWLLGTIRDFGGFPVILAFGIYVFFAVASSVQYLIAGWIYVTLPVWTRKTRLALPLAWITSNFLWIRIFPWEPGHLATHQPFTQIASLLGVQGVTFLLLWTPVLSELVFSRSREEWRRSKAFQTSLLAFWTVLACAAIWSSSRELWMDEVGTSSDKIAVTLIQANVTVEEKHNIRYFGENIERYKKLSEPFIGQGNLLVWPESVNQEWVHSSFVRASQSPSLSLLTQFAPLHLGTLTFDDPTSIHNSSLTISGSVVGPHSGEDPSDRALSLPYHKRVLMPFGEYVPLAKQFPVLHELVPMAAEFTAGSGPVIQSAEVGKTLVQIAPLICYEDVIQSMASEAIRAGGTILISIANDGWFGDTAAPEQHHAIARFRAIETGRYLLRSTNTGLTAIVNPLGDTIGTVPVFSDGVLSRDIFVIKDQTPYVRYDLGKIWWIVAALTFGYVLISFLAKGRKKDT